MEGPRPPKMEPKSAAPLSVPRRVRPMCFIYSIKYFALTTRGVRGTLTSQFSCFLARFLGPCWLYFSLLGASWAYLVLFWQSLLRCCSSRSNFWRLGTLRDRFWKVPEAFWSSQRPFFPRNSLHNDFINAVTTLFHLPALLVVHSGAAVCAQHMESAAPLSVPRRVEPIWLYLQH